MSEGASEVWGECAKCGHEWLVVKLPMELTKAARLMRRAACPACGAAKVLLAKPPESKP